MKAGFILVVLSGLRARLQRGKQAVKTLVNRLLSPVHKAMVDVSDDFIVLVLER